MPDLARLKELIETFDRNREAYLSGKFNETSVRVEFIDPLFELLGWDVHNKKGYAESYKDVYHEDTVLVKGATKAPDYSFRVGGTRKFFLEAKKPSVNIKGDPGPAFQLRRYGWSAKLPLSVLTNFGEFAVYDCRVKPGPKDKPSKARTFYFTCDEYLEKWDEIRSVFSRDAVLKGSFDKYAGSPGAKRGTAEVDSSFLSEIEGWRGSLARNLALRNPGLTQRELNFSVLRIIDRIIFLRMCEDREIEPYGQLQGLLNGLQVYPRLAEIFKKADDKYNSGLFHFKDEKGRPTEPYGLTLGLKIDDKVLKDIFKTVYYPESPYEFSVFPTEILGQVYEQFLGKAITLTRSRQAKVAEKPEVRKAGGVYYTPQYIVDYIVGQTLGALLKNRKPSSRAVREMKVLDPACGSGSFLLGAYQYLLDWHRDQYVKAGPDRHREAVYQARGGEWRLATAERKRILLRHIYGVDIDIQVVETSKLSLLLKVLEGESGETLKRQLDLFRERALPDLGNNVKCGNSLIGPEFYEGQQMKMFGEEEQHRINAFDWRSEFPEIMGGGGFDIVIGNPPYVRQETLGRDKEYFQNKFKVYHGMADLYAYFIEKGLSLVKKGGCFSYIVSNKWMRASYGEALREWLKGRRVEEIVDFGDLPVFQKAAAYPCILRIREGEPEKSLHVVEVKSLDFRDLGEHAEKRRRAIERRSLGRKGWSLADKKAQSLLAKLESKGQPLGEYVKGKIYRGVLTGLNKAFVIDRETREKLIEEDPQSAEIIKPFLAGRDIKRYKPLMPDKYLIFTRRGIDIKKYPAVEKHLRAFKKQLTPKPKGCKGDKWQGRKPGAYKWHEIQDAIDYYAEFEKPKIIYPNICKKPEFSFDTNNYYTNQKCFIISRPDKYLLGILNSSVAFFLFNRILPKLRGGFFEPGLVYFEKFPVRAIDFSDPKDKKQSDEMVGLVNQMLELNKKLAHARTGHDRDVLQRQIDAADRQIDSLVYKLYGLTKEEIKTVEESVSCQVLKRMVI